MERRIPMLGRLDLSPDLLATHGRALRGLARSLLRDADAAEDVVQETWLACLRRPQAMPERVSAWLGTVASRLALRRKRGEARRRVREARASTPERIEALQQRTLEREEALRTVTEALLGLEEPFKTALLLRFYEERTPGEIAAELDLPLTTVKSRIARGLERLRARLGAEFGEARRARALLVLAGAPGLGSVEPAPGPGAAGTAAPVLATLGALGVKLQAAAAIALLAGGALLWWNRPLAEHPGVVVASQDPPETRANLLGLLGARADTPAALAQSGGEATREALAPHDEEGARPEPFPAGRAFLYRVSGTVRDERGLPLPDALVFLGPRALPLNRVAFTDECGRFALEFSGRRDALTCVFGAKASGWSTPGLRELRLVAGQELVVDLALAPQESSAVAVVDAGTSSIELSLGGEAQDERAAAIRYAFPDRTPAGILQQTAAILTERVRGDSATPLDRAPELARGSSGRGIFLDPPPVLACARPNLVWKGSRRVIATQDAWSRLGSVQVPSLTLAEAGGHVWLGGVALEGSASLASVRGFVRDAGGAPLAEVEVGWGAPGCVLTQSVRTDETGAFELEGVQAGEIELHALGGKQGRARERVTLAAGEARTWNAALERGDELTGRVVLSTGDALAGQRVELWSVSPSFVWCDSTSTDEGGRFLFQGVPGGALELLVYTAGPVRPASAFPVRTLAPVFAPSDVGAIVLGVQDLVAHSLSATLLDVRGKPVPGTELCVWHEASGRGVFARATGEKGGFALGGLPAGLYRVEARSSFGRRDLGRVWVHEDLELGSERFALPGALVLDAPEAEGIALSLWSAHADVFARVAAGDELGARPLMLPPGAYVLCADPARGERVDTVLEVESATVSTLALRIDAEGTPRFEAEAGRGLGSAPELQRELRAARLAGCTSCHGGEAR